MYIPFGLVIMAFRFFMLLCYFAIGQFILPKCISSLWFWTTWGVSCFYKVREGGGRGGSGGRARRVRRDRRGQEEYEG